MAREKGIYNKCVLEWNWIELDDAPEYQLKRLWVGQIAIAVAAAFSWNETSESMSTFCL